ncbi:MULTISPECIES: hypothetical protein [unclassified Kitasatospora]|uniref:hypothetical protein n=1 Tax=unclassified Kitasatospora TaxID=2633591 RepID=UPI00070D6FF1|nr:MULTISPECIES: hypothetical protein [unclassified Kitasatospora]KQV09835.1 hypothetical protein ASC99_10505 [Kitasatospora sp. Root107]KRB70074.1 hypothetical protein ASE03_25855 [Kitasatospora sp. Root187]
MNRLRTRLALAGAAALTAVTVLTGLTGTAAATETPATADAVTATVPVASIGTAVVREDSDFLHRSAEAGIFVVPLPPGTAAYDSAAGFSGSFPVTGATGVLREYYGNVQLGGSLLAVNVRTGKTALFQQLAFDIDNWQLTGVPLGATAPVALLEPTDSTVALTAGVSSLTSTGLAVDAEGAQYLDSKLGTSFFTAGGQVGSFALSYTQGS